MKSATAPQCLVDQRPKWDNQIVSRKSRIIRPNKRKRRRKFL
jgi:hypothetical protein